MKRLVTLALAVGLNACGGAAESGGARSAEASEALPPEMQTHLHRATAVGRILHAYDQVAAEGTDVMQANADEADRASIGGYLVEHDQAGWAVVFFTRDADPQVLARIAVAPGKQASFRRIRPAEPASAAQRVSIRARQAALEGVTEKTQPLNPIVLTGADAVDARILAGEPEGAASTGAKSVVYLLAGTSRPDVAVLGRHYRALARADGTIEKLEALSKGPIEISAADLPPGATGSALFVTHVLGDLPTEAHVFASLLYRKPVAVATARGRFVVDGERITTIR